jgi:PAS fold
VEAVQDYAIFMLDPQGCVRTWNVGAERIKGYSAAEIIGKHFSCFYSREDHLGHLIGFGMVTKDLTELKRAESARLHPEHPFQLFVHCVQDFALFLLDADGYV